MKPNQVHVVATAVFCDSEQVIHALESRFTSQIVRDIGDANWINRIDDDVPVVHLVAATDPYVGARPDTNAAPDSPAPNFFAEAFGEDHKKVCLL